jgi:predicted ester cyclase
MQTATDKATAIRSMQLMGTGSLDEFRELYASDCWNRESKDEPPATRDKGPEAMYATALWLRAAFSDMAFEIHDSTQEGDLVTVHATFSGRQTGTFVAWAPDATIAMAFPARGRSFAVTHSHWFRMKNGKIVEHWANRDDRSMGDQLGWTPPTPVYLARMLIARRQAQRAVHT